MRVLARKPTALLIGSLALASTLAGCSAAAETPAQAEDDTATSETEASTEASAEAETETDAETESADPAGSGYTDGDYSATGEYQSPQGTESVDVAVTLADGIVTSVEVTPNATSGNSVRYQTQFAGGIAEVAEGVAIDDLAVDKVAGSSLTSDGFNAAIEQIKGDAAA